MTADPVGVQCIDQGEVQQISGPIQTNITDGKTEYMSDILPTNGAINSSLTYEQSFITVRQDAPQTTPVPLNNFASAGNEIRLLITSQQTQEGGNLVFISVPRAVTASKEASSRPTSYNTMERLLKRVPLKIVQDVLYQYNGMYYAPMTDLESKRLIMTYCKDIIEEVGSPNFVTNIYDFLNINPEIEVKIHDTIHQDLVGFTNGILDLVTGQFYPPSPQVFITNIVNDYYEQGQDFQCPYFDDFLYTAFQGDPELIRRAWEIIGYIITDDTRAKSFFVLMGVGNSGKSLLINLISSFFLDEAVCALQINNLGERFGLSLANGRKLCTFADLPKSPITDQAVGVIKLLTGGDLLSYEQKFKSMAKFHNTAKLLFATNHPIRLQSDDPAFVDRMVVLPFNYSVPRELQNRDLLRILKGENHAIIMRALKAYSDLRERNYIFSGEESVRQHEFQQHLKTISVDDLVEMFVSNCCELDRSAFTFTEDLYKKFDEFCRKANYSTMLKETFSKCLSKKYESSLKSTRRQAADGSNPRGYTGIRVKV